MESPVIIYGLAALVLVLLLLGIILWRLERKRWREIQLYRQEMKFTNSVQSGPASDLKENISNIQELTRRLEHCDAHWRVIFNATNEAIFIHDADTGQILDVNKTFEDMYGFTKDELDDISILDLSSDEGRFNEMQAMQLLRKSAGEGPQVFEWHARRKSGELFWVEVSLHYYEVGKEGRVIAVVRDISFRKDVEDALMESEEKYRTLFENANDSIFLMNSEVFLECNARTLELFGCKKEDIIGESPARFSPEKQPDGKTSADEARLRIDSAYAGLPQLFEWEHIRLDGTPFDAEVSLNLIKLHDQELLQALVRDVTDRKRAEKALQASEEKYRMIIENVPSVFWITNSEGRTSYISPNVSRVYGFAPEEIYESGNDLWLKRVHEDDLPVLLENYKKLFEDGEQFHAQYRIRHKDGNWIWLDDTGLIYSTKQGEKQAYGVFTDITEQKKIEKALLQSEEKFSKAFQINPSAMFLMDLNSRKRILINDSYLDITECSRDEILGTSFDELNFFADPSQYHQLMQMLDQEGRISPTDVDIITGNRQLKHVVITADVITISDYRFVLVVINDITERVKAQKALHESEEYYRSLYENISDGIFIVDVSPDQNFQLTGFNPAEEKMLNATAEKIRNSTLNELLPQGVVERLFEGFRTCIQEKKPYNYDEEELDSEGEKQFYSNTLVPLLNDKGEVYRIIGVARDITEKKHAQQKIYSAVLHAEEKERSRIAKELHDGLGPILSTIKLYVDWLLDPNKKTDSEPIIAKVDNTLNEAMRGLKEISNNLSPHILENYGLIAAMNNFIEKIGGPGGINIELKTNVQERLNSTIETTIYRILTECINNTLKYARAGNAAIHIEEDVEEISFTYSDDGVGFDVEAEMEKKMGMGLVNMKNRMEMIGGKMEIESNISEGTKIRGTIKTTLFF